MSEQLVERVTNAVYRAERDSHFDRGRGLLRDELKAVIRGKLRGVSEREIPVNKLTNASEI